MIFAKKRKERRRFLFLWDFIVLIKTKNEEERNIEKYFEFFGKN